jgi:hypothetical protein
VAVTAAGAVLTQTHRRAQVALRADVLADLTRMWRLFDSGDLMATFERFAAAAEILIRQRHDDSAGLAAAYFEEFRRREGVGGVASPRLPDPPPREVVRESLLAAGRSGAANALRAGRTPAAAAANGLVRVLGTASSLVLGGGRRTIVDSVRADPRAAGWQRATSGSPCAFCAMVASRGPVFGSERGARFQAHDHCSCSPEPYYRGSAPLPANQRFREAWQAAQRQAADADQLRRGTKNDALNAYRRYLTSGG